MANDVPGGLGGAQPIQVDPDALMQAATYISGLADAVRAERAKLHESHDIAVQGWVEPISRNAYEHWFGTADEQMGQRESELRELAAHLAQTAQSFRQADAADTGGHGTGATGEQLVTGYSMPNCDFKTFYGRNKDIFQDEDEARAVYNTINRARNGDKLWSTDGQPFINSPRPDLGWRRPPLPGKPDDYTEWTVNYDGTVPGDNSKRKFRRVLMGKNGQIHFTRVHYGSPNSLWKSVGGSIFYQLWWPGDAN